jgi:hypothetical protein
MSSTVYSRLTQKLKRRGKKFAGEVPVPQLYKEIDAGYRYFLARRIERETLRCDPIRIR